MSSSFNRALPYLGVALGASYTFLVTRFHYNHRRDLCANELQATTLLLKHIKEDHGEQDKKEEACNHPYCDAVWVKGMDKARVVQPLEDSEKALQESLAKTEKIGQYLLFDPIMLDMGLGGFLSEYRMRNSR